MSDQSCSSLALFQVTNFSALVFLVLHPFGCQRFSGLYKLVRLEIRFEVLALHLFCVVGYSSVDSFFAL